MKVIPAKEHAKNHKYIEEHFSYPIGDKNKNLIDELENGKSVLSMGCGSGREVRLLVKKKMRVTAVDYSRRMIDESRERERERGEILLPRYNLFL
ncbi:hypothetical protein COU54_02450 [Candidatus Pacearchaeota archaeon CG10_big_fil_rev_8_21_14_0_10_31_24]|nr:MAG: hypothetical protein COU54_02450 [Candidatus Pacearchaeota archaeon CG10_big_fil_rev_8_21_14_0_10_31_24]